MGYDVSGAFCEACDCDVICPCWADVDPPMGECTGLFAWQVTKGSVEGTNVDKGMVAMMTYGPSCDDGHWVLVLIGGFDDDPAKANKQAALARAVQTGPWANVIKAKHREILTGATITLSKKALSVTWKDQARSIEASANWAFDTGAHVSSQRAGGLARRVVGLAGQQVEVGRVTVPEGSVTGLGMLGEIRPDDRTDPYIYDLDITQVTAMRGKFHYIG